MARRLDQDGKGGTASTRKQTRRISLLSFPSHHPIPAQRHHDSPQLAPSASAIPLDSHLDPGDSERHCDATPWLARRGRPDLGEWISLCIGSKGKARFRCRHWLGALWTLSTHTIVLPPLLLLLLPHQTFLPPATAKETKERTHDRLKNWITRTS